jgi:uncharacterized protein (TIGR02186 family)
VRGLAFALALLVAGPARASDVAIALTDQVIEIDAGFSGAKITLFGVVSTGDPGAFPQEEYDIAALLQGPPTTFRLRPIEQKNFIYTPGPAFDIEAPGTTLTLSTRPLSEIADRNVLTEAGLKASAVSLAAKVAPRSIKAEARLKKLGPETIAVAYLEEARRRRLIEDSAGVVDFRKAGLFAIEIDLPPTIPVGDYTAEVFLFRNRDLVSRDVTSLAVRKIGVESAIFDFAHAQPLAYGVVCAAFSVVAGLLAAAAFRRP